jgi:DNA (cytosine-5)-methyltransferase 1
MRMLIPRELFRAQGFPDSYRIDIGMGGRALTKTAQVRMAGNSVCPPIAAALVRANVNARRIPAIDDARGSCEDKVVA